MNSFNLLSASSGSAVHPIPVAAAAPAVKSGPNVAAAAAMPAYAAGSSTGVAAMPVYTATYAAAAVSYSSDEEDDLMPWEREGWRPLEKSGKQKTPNKIRGELQRYIDACKADGSMTQTQIIDKMGVNSNTFRRFMNPKTYKDQWSAIQNGTYWAAGRLLEQVKYENEQAKKAAKKAGGKRKTDTSEGASKKAKTKSENPAAVATKSKAQLGLENEELINRILAVEGVPNTPVYDSCPQLVKKIKEFLARPGMTKAAFLKALDNLNSNSLTRFLAGKGQDQCGNATYRLGYVFFEKLRILEGKPKSAARKKNELEHPTGFSLEKARAGIWYVGPRW